MKRVKITSKMPPRVRHTGVAERLADTKVVAAALEADVVGTIPTDLSPPALRALREEISNRLTSRGGRPALEGTERRQKIPLNDEDWERLRRLADRIGADGFHPTPGQIASALLRISLANLGVSEARLRARESVPDPVWTVAVERFYRKRVEALNDVSGSRV